MSELEYNKFGDRLMSDDGYSIQELIDIIFSHLKLIGVITVLAGILAFSVSQFLITPLLRGKRKTFCQQL